MGNLLSLTNPHIPSVQRGQSDSTCLSGLSWGSDGEVPARRPALRLAHCEAFVQWWPSVLSVGLSHMLMGKTCPLPPLTMADLSVAVGDRTQQQLPGPRGLLLMPTAQSVAFILRPCWAVTGLGVGWARRTATSLVCSGSPSTSRAWRGVRPLRFEEEASKPPWETCCVPSFCFSSSV